MTVAWLAGSLKAKDKRASLEAAATGAAQLVIGTHAIIQEAVEFARLGLSSSMNSIASASRNGWPCAPRR